MASAGGAVGKGWGRTAAQAAGVGRGAPGLVPWRGELAVGNGGRLNLSAQGLSRCIQGLPSKLYHSV